MLLIDHGHSLSIRWSAIFPARLASVIELK